MKPLESRWVRIASFIFLALAVMIGSSTLWSQTTYPGQIGVEVSDRPTGFVDAFKDQGRLFIDSSGNPVPTDANGNPLSDGTAVIFDNRAVPEWLGYSDDPAAYQPDCSGTYVISFQGQATLSSVAGNPTLTFANQAYNPTTNTTTVNVTLPSGQPSLMVISFTNTQLTPGSATNTGIASLQAIRPGFTASQVFDPAFVNAFAPFGYLRFMGWLGTNTSPGYYGDTGHHLLSWSVRSLPTDFYQGVGGNISTNANVKPGAWGVSWEYVILLANATNKDIWINVPISATGGSDSLDPTYVASPDTSSYIYNLATLLKNGDAFTGNVGLNPGLHIYLEHSNEVWNPSFLQYTWNLLAAEDEVAKGGSVLNNDGDTNQYDWAYRRHIKRIYEIAQIFQSVFGAGSLNTTIRPVYTWWQLDEGSGSNAANALAWFKNTYGPPSNYFYAMAQGDYFTATNYANDTTIPDVLSDMQASSNASVTYVQQNLATAKQYGLPLYVYEGGPDNSNGGSQSTTNVGVQILANRDPGMNTLVQDHIRNNWFGQGGSNFGYFALSTAYSRYGDYGATDDYRNLTTAKYNALVNLTGYTGTGAPLAPGDLIASAGNQTVALSWEAVPGAANYNVKRGLASGGPYTTLATVSSPTYSDTAVTNGTTYYYVVTGVNSKGESVPSNEASAIPQATAPSAPTLTAAAGSGQATLTWTAPAGATSYNVYQGTTAGGESATPIATGIVTTSYTVPDLTNGSTYYFVVAAVNSLGTGVNSNEASVIPAGPPVAPVGLTATAGGSQAALSWTAVTGAASYNVYQGTAAGGENATPIATGITAATYTVTGLTDGTAYYFTVAAVNSSGASGFSNEATATPSTAPPPSGLLAYEPFAEAASGVMSGTSGSEDSGWAAGWMDETAGGAVPGYDFASATPLTYSNLATNGNYAIGGNGYSTIGRQLNVSASGPFSSYLGTGMSNGSPTSMIGAPGTTIWLSFLLRQDASGQPFWVSLNSNGGTYAYWVEYPNIAVGYFGSASNNASGNPMWGVQLTSSSGIVVGSALSNVPVVAGQPALLVLEVTFGSTQNQVNLYVNPTSLGGAAPTTPSATYSTATNLAFESLTYYGGNSTDQSSLDELRIGTSFAAVTPTPTVAAPAAPTGLTATAGNGQIQLAWNASTSATNYQVWYTTGGNYGEAAAAVTGTSYTLTGLTNGTKYTAYVTASNSAGTSNPSVAASATPAVAVVPGSPTGLTATSGEGQVALSWTAVSGATSYNVYDGTASGGENATPIATGVTGTTYTVTGLTNGTPYYFTVAAVDSAGNSGFSNEAISTPGTSYGAPVPITVPNNSFELDQQTGYIVPQNWNFTTAISTPSGDAANSNTAVQYVNSATNNPVTGITGSYYWDPNDFGEQSAPFGSEIATLTTAASLGTFAANSQYTLTVALGAPNDNALSSKAIGFQLLANGVVVASFVAPTTGPGALVQGNGMSDFSLTYSTVGQPQIVGQNITVALVYTYTGQYGRDAYFDNVRLTQAQAGATQAPTTTALSISPTGTLVSGSSYTLTAVVTPSGGSGTPSGNVIFNIGSTQQSATLDGTGTATYTGTVPAAGSWTISATYQGSTEFAASTSNTLNESVISYGTPVPIAVPNNSFELDQQTGYITPQAWNYTTTISTPSGDAANSNTAAPYVDSTANTPMSGVTGTYFWEPNDFGEASAPYGSETSTLTTAASLGTFAANTQYVLTVALGAPNDNVLSSKAIGFQLLANGVVVANFVAPTTGPGALVQGNGLSDFSLTYSTVGQPQVVGQNITVALVYTYTGPYGRNAYFDNVRLTQAQGEGIVMLPAPNNLTATAGYEQAALSWTAVSGATSYDIYQGTTSGGEGTTPVATGITANSFNVTGLTNGTPYYFTVAAVDSSGVGSVSNEATATPSASLGIPAAPTGLTAAAGDSSATLSWSAVPGASTYNIYRGTTAGGESSTPIATGVTGTTYMVTALTDGQAYYFTVAAVNTYGTSGFSNQASATPAAPVEGTNAPADFSIYSQVVASNPVPAGFNMQPAAGTNLTENAWLADGGFSPYISRMSFTASQDGSATTFIATGGGGTSFYSSIASGYFVGATAYTYRYTKGAWSLLRTDTVSGYTANSASTAPSDNTITFASSGPQILSGDITWLDMDNVAAIPNIAQLDPRFTIYYPNWATESQRGMTRGNTTPWPYTLSTDVPASDPGGYSLELTDPTTETNGIWQYVQSAFVGPTDEEFQAGHTYEVDVWLKQTGIGNSSATFSIQGLNITHTFTGLTGSWQHFTWTFPAVPGLPANSTQPSAHLDFNAPGTLYMDNFQLYDTGWAPNTVNPQVMQAWTDYHPGTVRIWSNFGNSSQNYSFLSLDSWLTPEIKTINTPGIGNEYEVPAELEHLPDALANVKTLGANPWLIVNMALSQAEWGELIDYLSAPAGVGYAAKRPANHPGPYTADFSNIYLEVGNEEWGTQQVPADTAYGQWAHFMISQAIAGKSYFNPKQIQFVLNGFYLEPNFGSAAIAAAPEASVVDNALYSSGNTALSGDAYYQSDLVQVPATNGPIINAIVAQQQLDAAGGRVYSLAAYEEGPGADSGSQSSGDNTLAAAIGAIDVNLYASQNGFGPQNLYMYQIGTGPFTSHTNFANGFRPHPIWEALQMRNNYCSGPMVLTNTNSVPTSTDGNNYPLIAVYTFQDAKVANQADVVVISRDLNNQTPVTLHFPATPTGYAQLYTLTGDPRLDNNTAMNIPIGSTQVAVTANYTFNMPPGSMYLFQVPLAGTWSTAVPAPSAPPSLSASANNGSVTLTWAEANGATGYNVLRGTANGGPYNSIGTTSQIAYTDTTVTNGTTYYYVVAATNTGGASGYSPQASATPNVEDSAMTNTQPPLDGSNTGAWANVTAVPLTHYFDGNATDKATYKTLWDNNYLYVLVSVQDGTLVAPTQANLYNGESVELYFSGTDTKSTTYGPTDFQYFFPYGNGGAVVSETYHSPNSLTGVLFGQQTITGGYQMAMALPWTSLGTTPVANQQYGFDVMIDNSVVQGTLLGKLGWWGTVNDTYDNPSLMGPLVLSSQAASASSLSMSATNPSPATGSADTLTATVTGSGGTPTGTVVFSSGATTLCSVTLTPSGMATCVFTPSTSGATTITAQYQGDKANLASSGSLTLNVSDASISLQLSSTQLVYPGATNVTACVAPAKSATATGTVKVLDGTTVLTTQTLQGNGCVYWYISPGLAAGTHVLTAAYSGDKNNSSGTSAASTVTVSPVTVNMSPSCWNASFAYGVNYQCTVSASSNAGSALGVITYSLDGGAAVSVPLSNGNAQFTITKPTAGTHQVMIAYAQQTNYAAVAPKTESFTVTPAPVVVALTPSTYYTAPGTNISFATAISSWSAGTPNATGSVSFYDGTKLLGSVPVNSSGQATFSTAGLAAGKHTITATYTGGANYASGSSSATITLAG